MTHLWTRICPDGAAQKPYDCMELVQVEQERISPRRLPHVPSMEWHVIERHGMPMKTNLSRRIEIEGNKTSLIAPD